MGRRPTDFDPVPTALAEAALAWVGTWRQNPFSITPRSLEPRGRPASFVSRTLAPLAWEAQVNYPNLRLGERTIRRRAANEGWDEWWLFDQMRTVAENPTFDHIRFKAAFNEILCSEIHLSEIDEMRLGSQHMEFPDVLRRQLFFTQPADALDADSAAITDLADEILLVGNRPEQRIDLTTALGQVVPLNIDLLAQQRLVAWSRQDLEAIHSLENAVDDNPIPRHTRWHLSYWEERITQLADFADTRELKRFRLMVWLAYNTWPYLDDDDFKGVEIVEGLRLENDWGSSPTDRVLERAKDFRVMYKVGFDDEKEVFEPELLRYLKNFSGEFNDVLQVGKCLAHALIGAIDRAEMRSNAQSSAEELVSKWWETTKLTVGALAVDECFDHVEEFEHRALFTAVTSSIQLLSVRVRALPLLAPALRKLLDLELINAPGAEREGEWPDSWQPIADQEDLLRLRTKDLNRRMSLMPYADDRHRAVSPMTFPRNPAVVAAAYALHELESLPTDQFDLSSKNISVSLSLPHTTGIADAWLQPRPLKWNPGTVDARLRKWVMGRPEELPRLLAESPGLVAAFLCVDDSIWENRREPEYLESSYTRSAWGAPKPWEDALHVWTAMQSIEYIILAPAQQRRFLEEAISLRIHKLLQAESFRRKREHPRVPDMVVNRLITAARNLKSALEGGDELDPVQRSRMNVALREMSEYTTSGTSRKSRQTS